jgi:hypothetical protein
MNDPKHRVGYKRPPAHMRFRPGHSGNPAGRPKRRPSFPDALLVELAEPAPAQDSKRAGNKLQALVRTLVDTAIAGDARAQSLLIGALGRLADIEDHGPSSLSSDDREILEGYVGDELKRRAGETEAAPSAGVNEPNED